MVIIGSAVNLSNVAIDMGEFVKCVLCFATLAHERKQCDMTNGIWRQRR